MTNRAKIISVAATAAALALSACGADDEGTPIPAEQAQALQRQLDSIEARFDVGGAACREIIEGDDTNVRVVNEELAKIPGSVEQDVRDALRRSFERLFELVRDRCEEEPTETETETAPPPPITVPPEPETETAPPETEPQPTEPEERRERPGGGRPRDPGNGNGGGNGDGGAEAPGDEG